MMLRRHCQALRVTILARSSSPLKRESGRHLAAGTLPACLPMPRGYTFIRFDLSAVGSYKLSVAHLSPFGHLESWRYSLEAFDGELWGYPPALADGMNFDLNSMGNIIDD
ncbi:hypothetical protein BDW72DRAFT_120791 [Aspergillus terricola var. indicus]